MMKQLVNFSDYPSDMDLIQRDPDRLQTFLQRHHLDGIEMMLCSPCPEPFRQKDWLYGVHLQYWPCWLDFWRNNRSELLRQFGSEQQIKEYYGALDREAWLESYKDTIKSASQSGARYLVFHVSHARVSEVFSRQFTVSDHEVIEAAIEVINEIAPFIPADMALLFENLWWPGLTLQDKRLAAHLLDRVNHENIGIMLDTGHLMNTNPALRTEPQGIEYILKTLHDLGQHCEMIRGIHLHKSLSGLYVEQQTQREIKQDYDQLEIMQHVLQIDQHLPFTSPHAQKILNYVQPEYLVHEFLYTSIADWSQKISQQQTALQINRQEMIRIKKRECYD